MSKELTEAFKGLLAQDRNRPDLWLSAQMESGKETRIDLVLTFKAGCRYCCGEPGCYLWPFKPEFWLRLRKALAEAGVAEPCFPMTLHVKGVVEEGAIFTSEPMLISRASEYDEEYHEEKYHQHGNDSACGR
jgi:hypothetical protein